MKKLLAILLAVCMVLSLAACGGDSGSDATNPGGSSTPTQGSQSGDSKDPAIQPTTQNDPTQDPDSGEYGDPDYTEDPGYEDDPYGETTEPTQGAVDLSNEPNPFGLNSLILAAFLNKAGSLNYNTGETTPIEFTQEMLEGIQDVTIYGYDDRSIMNVSTYYVTNKDTAASEEEYEYNYKEVNCEVSFLPRFSADDLNAFCEDLKAAEKITQISMQSIDLESLAGFAKLPELTMIIISGAESLTSLDGLENLTKLGRLDCTNCYALEDISALANLTALDYLSVSSCNVSDVSPLANLTNLETLHLGNNPITDMSPLANLPKLNSLGLGSTDITVIPEGGTTAVTYLSLGDYECEPLDVKNIAQWLSDSKAVQISIPFDRLQSFEGLEQIGQLDFISVYGETITNEDMAFLGKLHVKQLQITNTTVTDLSAFAGNEYIENLTITTPELTDVSPLASCPNLNYLSVSGTAVTDLSGLAGMESLISLNLSRTSITDLSSISAIPNLESLTLSRNEALTDISPLVNCPKLAYLYLELCTSVKDISALASSTTLKRINIDGIEGLDTAAFDGTEIEIQKYY